MKSPRGSPGQRKRSDQIRIHQEEEDEEERRKKKKKEEEDDEEKRKKKKEKEKNRGEIQVRQSFTEVTETQVNVKTTKTANALFIKVGVHGVLDRQSSVH